MKPSVPVLMSFNGGYVDTAGFLTLQGLFTAHVTGNFVTFGAALAHGTSGALAKLLALPVFCLVVVLVRVMGHKLPKRGVAPLESLLLLKLALLTTGAALALKWGPFADGDAWQAIVTGMTLVAAMAVQNAIHRIHLSQSPPTTLMTGTSTQMMIDVADLITGQLPPDARAAARARLQVMSASVGAFALGCAGAALAFVLVRMSIFVIPPLVALAIALSAQGSGETSAS